MKFQEFLSNLRHQMRQYSDSGLIDDADVLMWVTAGLKKFGATIMIDHETIVEVENNKAILPDNFYTLKHALKCDKDFIECDKESEKILVKSLFWTDVQLKQKDWNVCTGECHKNRVEEFTIREATYIDGNAFTKYYKNPVELKLSTAFKKSICDNECLNKYRSNSPYEINIIGKTLHTNFKSGDVYLRYKGLEMDEDGLVIIPDTDKNELETYLMYFVKRNIYEIVAGNNDDTNVANMFKYFIDMERQQFALALTAAKFSGLTPQSMYKLRGRNQKERKVFERIPRR